jgi:dUTP pyrophosphatase
MSLDLNVKKLSETAILPTYANEFAAGLDFYIDGQVDELFCIGPDDIGMIGTGIAIEIPEGYYGMLVIRSGIAAKKHLTLANGVGIIDSDYRGEIKLILKNNSKYEQYITAGERIAQLILMPFERANIIETETLSKTIRAEAGFGSTGNF